MQMRLRMTLIAAMCLIALAGHGKSPFVGTWQTMDFSEGDQMKISANMSLYEENGKLQGTIELKPISKKAKEVLSRLIRTKIGLEKVSADGKNLSFEIPIIPGDRGDNVVCKLTLDSDVMKGQMWEVQANERKKPMRFKRIAADPVHSIKVVDDAGNGLRKLCKELVEAVAANDQIQYAQCWTTKQQIIANLKTLFPKVREEDMGRPIKKMHQRNNAVLHSFRIIQAEIGDPARTVKFGSVTFEKMKKVKFGNKEFAVASRIICSFKVGPNTWALKLDDAIEIGGQWYFSDDATELKTHQKRIGLRMFKGKFGRVIEVKNEEGVQL